MKTAKTHFLRNLLIVALLILTSIFTVSCYDVDNQVNLSDSVTHQAIIKENTTVFTFYYENEETPIETYNIIRVEFKYYLDYNSWMKTKSFFFIVPDDITYGEKPTFTAELKDVLTNQSVVYLSIGANIKPETTSRFWEYFISTVIAFALLIFLCPLYSFCCEHTTSTSLISGLMWLGGLIIYGVVAYIIGSFWDSGPCSIIITSAIFYFLLTLPTFFRYKH